jgi:hypothetical protein
MEVLEDPPALPSPPPRRGVGRPRKGTGPRINYAELDQLIVFGEPGVDPRCAVRYPSYRELAVRYGVVTSVIAEYASKHDCQRRRKRAAARIRALADKMQIELRASAQVNGEAEADVSPVEVVQGARREALGALAESPPNAPA